MLFKLDQYWRFFATASCYVIFGIGAIIITSIAMPLLYLISSNQMIREYRVQSLICFSFDKFCKAIKFVGAMDYQFIGIEKLKNDKNCLIVANHPSLLDYVLIASQLKQCDCLVKTSIWRNPFLGFIVRAAGYIPSKSPDDLLNMCEERFQLGNVLLIFPEGTRTTSGKKSKLQRGAAQIAIRTQRNIRVVHISTTHACLTKEIKWYQTPMTKPFFSIEIKDIIEVKPFIEHNDNVMLAVRKLNHHLEDVIFPQKK